METLKILEHKIYTVHDKVYFVINSLDNPVGFVLCYGEIINKTSKGLNVVYSIRLLRILSNHQDIIRFFHMKTFHVQYEKSEVFKKVQFNVIDILDHVLFDEKLQEKTLKVLFTVQAFMCHHTYDEAMKILEKTKDISTTILRNLLANQ